jgi:hypothetical protein
MTASAKGKYGGLGPRGWATFKYEKMGEWNRAQDQQKRNVMMEASKPKDQPTQTGSFSHGDSDNWKSLGSVPVATQSLGAWGKKEALEGVRQEEAVVKPEVVKPTMEFISKSKGDDHKDEAAFMDQGRASKLPTGPKKFKSQTVVQAPPRPAPGLSRSYTCVPKSTDAWSDDEDADESYLSKDKTFSVRKGPLMIPGMMNHGPHDMDDWEADQAEYA